MQPAAATRWEMAESFTPAGLPLEKASRYRQLEAEIIAVLAGETDAVARMATVCSMVASAFPDFLWTGFYRVDTDRAEELVVAPYQGSLGCLRIPFGRGVCGAAALGRQTVIVADVEAFDGHIACDSRSRSEIVVPVFDPAGVLLAVLDIDSAEIGAFDSLDQKALESLMFEVFGR